MWIGDASIEPDGLHVALPVAIAIVTTTIGGIGIFIRWMMTRQDDLNSNLQNRHDEMVVLLNQLLDGERNRSERMAVALTDAANALRELRQTIIERLTGE